MFVGDVLLGLVCRGRGRRRFEISPGKEHYRPRSMVSGTHLPRDGMFLSQGGGRLMRALLRLFNRLERKLAGQLWTRRVDLSWA